MTSLCEVHLCRQSGPYYRHCPSLIDGQVRIMSSQQPRRRLSFRSFFKRGTRQVLEVLDNTDNVYAAYPPGRRHDTSEDYTGERHGLRRREDRRRDLTEARRTDANAYRRMAEQAEVRGHLDIGNISKSSEDAHGYNENLRCDRRPRHHPNTNTPLDDSAFQIRHSRPTHMRVMASTRHLQLRPNILSHSGGLYTASESAHRQRDDSPPYAHLDHTHQLVSNSESFPHVLSHQASSHAWARNNQCTRPTCTHYPDLHGFHGHFNCGYAEHTCANDQLRQQTCPHCIDIRGTYTQCESSRQLAPRKGLLCANITPHTHSVDRTPDTCSWTLKTCDHQRADSSVKHTDASYSYGNGGYEERIFSRTDPECRKFKDASSQHGGHEYTRSGQRSGPSGQLQQTCEYRKADVGETQCDLPCPQCTSPVRTETIQTTKACVDETEVDEPVPASGAAVPVVPSPTLATRNSRPFILPLHLLEGSQASQPAGAILHDTSHAYTLPTVGNQVAARKYGNAQRADVFAFRKGNAQSRGDNDVPSHGHLAIPSEFESASPSASLQPYFRGEPQTAAVETSTLSQPKRKVAGGVESAVSPCRVSGVSPASPRSRDWTDFPLHSQPTSALMPQDWDRRRVMGTLSAKEIRAYEEAADSPSPVFLSSIAPDDASADRMVPRALSKLAPAQKKIRERGMDQSGFWTHDEEAARRHDEDLRRYEAEARRQEAEARKQEAGKNRRCMESSKNCIGHPNGRHVANLVCGEEGAVGEGHRETNDSYGRERRRERQQRRDSGTADTTCSEEERMRREDEIRLEPKVQSVSVPFALTRAPFLRDVSCPRMQIEVAMAQQNWMYGWNRGATGNPEIDAWAPENDGSKCEYREGLPLHSIFHPASFSRKAEYFTDSLRKTPHIY